MTRRSYARTALVVVLVATLLSGLAVGVRSFLKGRHTSVVAYFANSNGIFPGDEVRILGVPVGKIDTIEPQPGQVKITFWFSEKYRVPAEAKAVILSPSVVTARAIQLVPAYTGGPAMRSGAVIPQSRTAVPVEWDDLRVQLKKFTEALQPTRPGGVSTFGEFINTYADNVRGEGGNIRQSIITLSQAFAALGDHSGDLFGTFKNLSALVTALQSSTDLMGQLNRNLAATTALLANDPNEVGQVAVDVDSAVGEVTKFVAENRESLGIASDKVMSISNALIDSLPDIKQTLHILPNTAQNFLNIYQPAQATLSGILATNNFSNPIMFLCGAVQAASRLGAEQAAKLCVQYLAPIVKNRQYNFPPIGGNPFVGAAARPNEITYSEDRLRPDYRPTPPPEPAPPTAAETDPAHGLAGIMVPAGGGS